MCLERCRITWLNLYRVRRLCELAHGYDPELDRIAPWNPVVMPPWNPVVMPNWSLRWREEQERRPELRFLDEHKTWMQEKDAVDCARAAKKPRQ